MGGFLKSAYFPKTVYFRTMTSLFLFLSSILVEAFSKKQIVMC